MISGFLSWMIFTPMIGMAVIMFLPKDNHRLIRGVTMVATGIPLLLSLMMLASYNPGTADFQFVEFASVDTGTQRELPPRRRRYLRADAGADRALCVSGGPGLVQHHQPRERVFRLLPASRSRHDRRLLRRSTSSCSTSSGKSCWCRCIS